MKRKLPRSLYSSMYWKSVFPISCIILCAEPIQAFNVRKVVSLESNVQQTTISGKVVDAQGQPLVGVTVQEKGTHNSTSTNDAGAYIIQVQSTSSVLSFTYVGYESLELAANNAKRVELNLSNGALEEVVVVGYGTQKKVNLTGAIASVSGDVLKNRPINNIASGLQGTVPNLTITNSNGNPKGNPTINVRGTTSINGGGPLVLVDGVEMNLNLVNPNDVENVTVLKDAASAAIYGVRAAFGVVLITTKGAKGVNKTQLSYSGNVGFSQPSVFPEVVKKNYEHAEYINNAMLNAGLAVMYSEEEVDAMKAWTADPKNNPDYLILGGVYKYVGYNDWNKMLLKDFSPSQRHFVSASGGSEKTKFYSSVGYTGQDGMLKINNDKFERISTRLSVENQTTNWLKLGLKALYTRNNVDEPTQTYGNATWHQFVFTSPVRPFMWTGDSKYPQYDQFKGMYFDDQNPYSLLALGGRDKTNMNEIWNTFSADANILDGWTAHMDFNYNYSTSEYTYHKKKIDLVRANFLATEGNTANNYYRVYNSMKNYYAFNAFTQYEKTLGKHYLKGMVGYNQELTQTKYTDIYKYGQLNQEMPSLGLGTGTQTINESGYEWALRGGFFRLNYIFDNKYLFEVNGRYDGTSRFPKEDRFVFLPSFSAGWRVSEEKFMDWSNSFLNDLKLRGSYGRLGNQLLTSSDWVGNMGYYPYIPFMSNDVSGNNNYLFNNDRGTVINPPGLVDRNLSWEKASTLNFGVDVALFNSRLNAVFDIYTRKTSDMLTSIAYPEVLGAASPVQNIADLETKGYEFTLSWADKINSLNYKLSAVLGDSQGTITKFDNPTGSLTNYYVGQKIGEIWGYETLGFFKDAADVTAHASQAKLGSNWSAGDIKYADLNGDGEVSNGSNTLADPGDRRVIGNATPRYTYGFNADVDYKGFFVNLFVQGVGKRDYWPSGQAFWPVSTQYFTVQQWQYDNTWSEENTDAYFPKISARNTRNQSTQTKYLQDASYLRLKNLTIGYNFNKSLLEKIKMNNLQVYLSGENLFFLSKIKGNYDPESAPNNGAVAYPFSKTYSLGLSLSF
ncbi:TonB-dependent receptor [Sphingobacterium sp. SRCM116780]|uniref:SusC/RagA family TonB-linked outer membrane protein n=1 Tax=Sphingobacterium sp. SRCM116780 TaxID=2907623 RepID=UPI001F323438|nr:TonB-dependent receptor [Sphingobacterium sp. SRCM116780]UIR55883.1 TonB-dependent receptor [Sphingobacterium sp. SRCM116780]